nr:MULTISPECIES: inositol monophosphatase [Listeria]
MSRLDKEKQFVSAFFEEAGAEIMASFEEKLEIETKSNRNDLVTNIDKQVETLFVKRVLEQFPDHRIFGEEGMAAEIDSLEGPVWIVDPIDGTLNFVMQQKNFTISVALYIDGVGVYGAIYEVEKGDIYTCEKGCGAYLNGKKLTPVNADDTLADHLLVANLSAIQTNERLWEAVKASRGLRLYGAASLEYMYVATGKVGAYMSANLAPWDIAAGKMIAEELGCIVTRLDGSPINMLEQGSSLVALPNVHKTLLDSYLS